VTSSRDLESGATDDPSDPSGPQRPPEGTSDDAPGTEIDPASFLGPGTNPASGLAAAAPIMLFVLINARFFIFDDVGTDRRWFAAAVLVSVTWSVISIIRRRRQGALIVSVLIGRSIAATGAPYIFGFSQEVQEHPSYLSAMAHVTLIGAAYEFASAGFDIWLLFIRDASANQFVIVRYIVNWGASTITLFGAFAYLGRRLNEIEGFPGIMRIFEAHVDATAQRFGWDLSE